MALLKKRIFSVCLLLASQLVCSQKAISATGFEVTDSVGTLIGVSSAEDAINVIAEDVTISNRYTYFDTLTIDPVAPITASSASALNSTSSEFSSLIVNGEINGILNYSRYTVLIDSAVNRTNDLLSAPVVYQIFGAFATTNTNLAASNTLRAFVLYNTNAGAYENYNTTTNATTTLVAGIGYRATTTVGSTLKFMGTARTVAVDVFISAAVVGNA